MVNRKYLLSAIAFELRNLEADQRTAQLGLREGYVAVALALRDLLLGAAAGLLGARLVDLIGTLSGIGQDGHPIRQHFHEAARDREWRGRTILDDRQLADIKDGQE